MYSYPIRDLVLWHTKSILVQWHNTPSCCCCECSLISWDIGRSVLARREVGCVMNTSMLVIMVVIILMVGLTVLNISTKLFDH